MTVIRPNSITGVTSITAQGTELTLHRSDGSILDELKSNINASSGVSTIANLDSTNINITGVSTFSDDVIVGVSTFFVDVSTGRVGIGTDVPTEELHVIGDIYSDGGYFRTKTGVEGGLFDVSGNNGWTVDQHILRGYTNGNERLRVNSSGNVGIGTTNPGTRLHVETTSQVALRLRTTNSSTANPSIQILDPTGAKDGLFTYTNDGIAVGSYTAHPLSFIVQNSERARITSSGNLGIGTATPRSALDLAEKTDAVALPQGTTAQRPTGDNPYLRWNTTNSALEFYNGTAWVEIISDYFPTGSMITPE